jgi:tetratricopeptide (TPR) repeat protein
VNEKELNSWFFDLDMLHFEFEISNYLKYKMTATTMRKNHRLSFLFSLANAGLIFFTLSISAGVVAQTPSQPTPTPTPRRPLPKPLSGARGFEQYANREASSRLAAGAATRGETAPEKLLYEDGEAAYAAGNYQSAVENFSKAVRLKPNWAEARYALALSLIEMDNLKAAIEEFKQVVKLKPSYQLTVMSNYNLGNAYFDLGEFKEAIDAYKQAIELNPELSRPHNNLGLAYAASGQLPLAVGEFNRAVQLRADYVEAHFNLGVAYLESNKKPEAQDQQRILLKLNSELAAKLDALIKK